MKKRLLSIVLVVAMLLSMMPAALAAETGTSWYDADATELTIGTVAELQEFALITQGNHATIAKDSFAGKTVKLGADIDLTGTNWYYRDEEGTVVADYRIVDFAGAFDGNGKTISNIRLLNEYDTGSSVGLCFFRSVTGSIKNLTLDGIDADCVGNASFYAINSTMNNAGGYNTENVHVKNVDVYIDNDECAEDTYSQVAGMIRWHGGSGGTGPECRSKDCSVTNLKAVVTGKAAVGGFSVFIAQRSWLYNCDVTNITFDIGSVDYGAGGFAGHVQSSSYVQRVFNDCDVSNLDITVGYLDAMVGGFLGNLGGMVDCDGCDVTGKITIKADIENAHVGGFTGDLGWQGDWSSDKIGHTFDKCTADVDITAVNSDVGGFVGMSAIVDDTALDQDEAFAAVFTDCSARGDVTTVNGAAGGFVGSGDRGEYTGCTAAGAVSGNIAGGFWGEVFSMPAAPANGNSGKGEAFTGVVISGSTGSANVTGTTYTAGLIGYLDNNDSEKAYATPITLKNNTSTVPAFNKSADTTAVAEVNGKLYDTLAEAVEAANEAGTATTVTLFDDVTLGEKLTISGSVTISGDYTITRDDAYTGTLFAVNAGAALTLDGGLTIDGGNNWVFDETGYNAALADSSEHKDFAFVTSAENAPVATADLITINGTVVMNKATIKNHMGNSSCNVFGANANSALILNAGALITHCATPFESTVIAMSAGSTFTINDGAEISGNYAGRNGGVSRNNNGTIVMNGGSICHNSGTSYGGVDAPYTGKEGNASSFEINGGYVGENISIIGRANVDVNGGEALTINGGTFTQNVWQWVPSGYSLPYDEATGTYSPVSKGESGYMSYVSLGDSMTNGYGLTGYGNNGYGQYGKESYANQFAEKYGFDHTQLAMSAMRAEDLHFILEFPYADAEAKAIAERTPAADGYSKDTHGDNYKVQWWNDVHSEKWNAAFAVGDYYTWNEFTDGRFDSNCDNVAVAAEAYQSAVKGADVISIGSGNANFGVFLLGRLLNAMGTFGGSAEEDAWMDIDRALAECDPTMQSEIKLLITTLEDKLWTVLEQNGMSGMQGMAEKLVDPVVYTVTSYLLNYAGAVEAVLQLKPDAEIILVGIMNTMAGMSMNMPAPTEDDPNAVTVVPLADVLGVIVEPVNAFIAALPTYMQAMDNGVYADAVFYYAEAPEVDCIVNTYEENINGNNVIRNRFITEVTEELVWEVAGPIFNNLVKDYGLELVALKGGTENAGREKVEKYEKFAEEWETYQKSRAAATEPETDLNDNEIISAAIYLAFEEAVLNASNPENAALDMNAIGSLMNGFDGIFDGVAQKLLAGLNMDAIADGVTADVMAVAVAGANDYKSRLDDTKKATFDYIVGQAAAYDELAAVVAHYVMENNISDIGTVTEATVTDWVMKTYANAVSKYASRYIAAAITEPLAAALTADDEVTLKGLLHLFGRMLIGDGLGAHPSAEGHATLAAAVINSYENGYTAEEETRKNLTELVAEAYAQAYAQAQANGAITAAEAALTAAKAALGTAADYVGALETTDELADTQALLVKEINNTIETITALEKLLDNSELTQDNWAEMMALEAELDKHAETIADLAAALGVVGELALEDLTAAAEYYAGVVEDIAADAYAWVENGVKEFNAEYAEWVETVGAAADKIDPELGKAVRVYLTEVPEEAMAIIYAAGEDAVIELVAATAAASDDIATIVTAVSAVLESDIDAIVKAVAESEEVADVLVQIDSIKAEIEDVAYEMLYKPVSTALAYEQKLGELKAELAALQTELVEAIIAAAGTVDAALEPMLNKAMEALGNAVGVAGQYGEEYGVWFADRFEQMVGELLALLVRETDELGTVAGPIIGELISDLLPYAGELAYDLGMDVLDAIENEVIPYIIETVEQYGAEAWDIIKANIDELLKQAADSLDEVIEALKTLAARIEEEAPGAIENAYNTLVDAVYEWAKETAPEVADWIYDYLYNNPDKVIAFVKEYGDDAAEFLSRYADETLAVLGYIIANYGEEIAEYVMDNADEILAVMTAWVEEHGENAWALIMVYLEELGLIDAAEDAYEAVEEFLKGAGEDLQAAVETVIDVIETAIGELEDALEDLKTELEDLKAELEAKLEELEDASGEVKAEIEAAIEKIEEAIEEVEKAIEAIEEKIAELQQIVSDIVEAVEDVAAALEMVSEDFEAAVEALKTALGDLADAIGAAGDFIGELNDAVEGVQDIIAEVVDVLTDLNEQVGEIAGEVAAVVTGALEKLEELADTIQQAVEDLRDAIDNAVHGEYEISCASYYVAIGDDTVAYPEKLAELLGMSEQYSVAVLEDYELDAAELAELEKADLVTLTVGYGEIEEFVMAQAMGSVVEIINSNAKLVELLNSNADIRAAVEEYVSLDARAEVLDWTAYLDEDGIAVLEEALAEVRAALIEEGIPEVYTVDVGAMVQPILDQQFGAGLVTVDLKVDVPVADLATSVVEWLVYGGFEYAYSYADIFELIRATAPEAHLVVTGAHNSLEGMEIEYDGTVIPVGEYAEYVFMATDLNAFVYALLNGDDVTYVPACGEYSANDEHMAQSIYDALELTNIGHLWGEWTETKAPTETEKGEETRVCSNCGEIETREVPELGHTHALTHTGAKDATCSETGNIEYWYCSGCGKYFSDENAETEITEAETVVAIDADAHIWGEWTSNGSSGHKRICANDANHTETEAHSYGGDKTCDVCGYKKSSGGGGGGGSSSTSDKCNGGANCPSRKFTDLAKALDANRNIWWHESTDYVIKNGLMNGMTDELFMPNTTSSRAMLVTILWREEGSPVVNYNMTFEDVAADEWYTEAIRWAASEGIVEGHSDTKFAPNENVTREQMVTIFYRFAKYKGADVTKGNDKNILGYNDSSVVSDWAYPALQWACGVGFVEGKENALIDPLGNATRAEMATLIMRFIEDVLK